MLREYDQVEYVDAPVVVDVGCLQAEYGLTTEQVPQNYDDTRHVNGAIAQHVASPKEPFRRRRAPAVGAHRELAQKDIIFVQVAHRSRDLKELVRRGDLDNAYRSFQTSNECRRLEDDLVLDAAVVPTRAVDQIPIA